MKLLIGTLLLFAPAVVTAGPFPFPMKSVDAVAEVEVVLPRRGGPRVRVLHWIRAPKRRDVALGACFSSRRALRAHEQLMWSTYWATRKTQLPGDRERAMVKAKQEWRVKGKPLRRLLERAARLGRYRAIVSYNRVRPGRFEPLCGFDDVIYLRHWVNAPGHRRWRAKELRLVKNRKSRRKSNRRSNRKSNRKSSRKSRREQNRASNEK